MKISSYTPVATLHRDDRNRPIPGTTSYLSASGANVLSVDHRNASDGLLIFNPGVKGDAHADEISFSGKQARDDAMAFGREFMRGTKYEIPPVIVEDDLWGLGDQVIRFVADIALRPPDLVIFPLRGGARLQDALEGMLVAHPPFTPVPFTEAASNPRDDFHREVLAGVVAGRNPGNENFSIAVADVGDSGAGMRKMAQLLGEVRRANFKGQRWKVRFHMFHRHYEHWRFWAPSEPNGIDFFVESYPISMAALLLDDREPFIGRNKTRERGVGGIFIPRVELNPMPAALVIQSNRGYEAIASIFGLHLGNKILSRYTTASIETVYERRPQCDLWGAPNHRFPGGNETRAR